MSERMSKTETARAAAALAQLAGLNVDGVTKRPLPRPALLTPQAHKGSEPQIATTGEHLEAPAKFGSAKQGEPKCKVGRPEKKIDLDQVRRIAKLGGSQAEAAKAVGCSLATLKNHFGSKPAVKAAWTEGRLIAKARAAEKDVPPRRNEGRVLLNLERGMIGQLRKIASEQQVTPHAVAVAAISTYLTDLRP